MEWLIPMQTFQVENVQLGMITNTSKPLIPLAYKDAEHHFPSLSILLPILKIKSFDASTGHFIISLSENQATINKLQTLQEMLLKVITLNSGQWFPRSFKKPADIRAGYQPLIQGTDLHLYCPIQPQIAQSVPFFNGTWSKTGIQAGLLIPGSKIRLALRVQGISFHIHPSSGQWSGKFRLQHKLLAILI
jgi:hypothetical protein